MFVCLLVGDIGWWVCLLGCLFVCLFVCLLYTLVEHNHVFLFPLQKKLQVNLHRHLQVRVFSGLVYLLALVRSDIPLKNSYIRMSCDIL